MSSKRVNKRGKGKRNYKKHTSVISNPVPLSDDDKSYIFVVKNHTDKFRFNHPDNVIQFELPEKRFNEMKNEIKIYIKPTKLYLYNKETNIITGPFIGITPTYKDNRKGIKFPSKINVKLMKNYLRININKNRVVEGLSSYQYINDIIYDSLPKLPQLDVGVQVSEREIKKETEHISEAVFESLGI